MPTHYLLTPITTDVGGEFSEIYEVKDASGALRVDLIAKKIGYTEHNMPFRTDGLACSDFYQEATSLQAAGLLVDYAHDIANRTCYFIMKKAKGMTLLEHALHCCHVPLELQDNGISRYMQTFNHILTSQMKKEFRHEELAKKVQGLEKAILDFQERTGRIHNDLHPENIMIDDTPTGVTTTFIDLGLTRFATLKNKYNDFSRICAFIFLSQDPTLAGRWGLHYIAWPHLVSLAEMLFIAAVFYRSPVENLKNSPMIALAKILGSRLFSSYMLESYLTEFESHAKQGQRIKRKRLKSQGVSEIQLKNRLLDCFSEENSAKILLMRYYAIAVAIVGLALFNGYLTTWHIANISQNISLQEVWGWVSLMTAACAVYLAYDSVHFGSHIAEQIIDSLVSSKEHMAFKLALAIQKPEAEITIEDPSKQLYFTYHPRDRKVPPPTIGSAILSQIPIPSMR